MTVTALNTAHRARRRDAFLSAMVPLLAVVLLACGASRAQAQQVYVDAVDYPTAGAGWEAFDDLERRLAEDFDQSCGDTFCEGDYSNIQSLRFVCSVQPSSGRIGSCGWSFAASEESLVPASGGYEVHAPTWFCLSPLQPGTTFAIRRRMAV